MEDRLDTGIADVWPALTDPSRLARWYGDVEGDLRPGGNSPPTGRVSRSMSRISPLTWPGGSAATPKRGSMSFSPSIRI